MVLWAIGVVGVWPFSAAMIAKGMLRPKFGDYMFSSFFGLVFALSWPLLGPIVGVAALAKIISDRWR